MLLLTIFLHLCRSLDVVWPTSMVYFEFYFYCFCFYGFYDWVLVYVKDHFYRDFVLFIAALCLSSTPARGLFFPFLDQCPHLNPAKGLLILTGLKTLQRTMPLINTDLVQSPLCVDKSLTLYKVDRAGKILIYTPFVSM
jgi:hypothetical protein